MHPRGRKLVGGGSIDSDTNLNMASCLRSAGPRPTGAETPPVASFSVSLRVSRHVGSMGYAQLRFRMPSTDTVSVCGRFLAAIARAPFWFQQTANRSNMLDSES